MFERRLQCQGTRVALKKMCAIYAQSIALPAVHRGAITGPWQDNYDQIHMKSLRLIPVSCRCHCHFQPPHLACPANLGLPGKPSMSLSGFIAALPRQFFMTSGKDLEGHEPQTVPRLTHIWARSLV